jgi:hypothetical protein
MSSQQWRTLKILFAYFLWICDFIVWSNGWTDSYAPRWETGLFLLIYLVGLLIIMITS